MPETRDLRSLLQYPRPLGIQNRHLSNHRRHYSAMEGMSKYIPLRKSPALCGLCIGSHTRMRDGSLWVDPILLQAGHEAAGEVAGPEASRAWRRTYPCLTAALDWCTDEAARALADPRHGGI